MVLIGGGSMNVLIAIALVASMLWGEGEERSTKKAIMLSVTFPGLGELYMGEKDDAIRAFILESGVILTYIGFNKYAGILRDDYIIYSHQYAGARTGMDENYYNALEWYGSRESYNENIRDEARRLFPNDREAQLRYIEENEIPVELDWEWNEKEWERYRDLRKGERKALSNASYCIAAGIVNRVISAVISARLGRNKNINLYLEPDMGIRFCYRF